tara:strand:- start:5338 stop:6033 length:696 start_codon:yes stop_codon:yes gene_type:complete
MTLLTMINGAQDTIGLNRSATVVSSTDTNTRTLLALAQTEGQEVLERFSWPQTQAEATHTTLAAQLQGVMTTIAPGFSYIINQTFWNRTLTQPVLGPLSPSEWQLLVARTTTGPYSQFRIRAGQLFAYPAPVAGQTWVFEYQTLNFCESAGGTDQSAWLADTDTGLMSENLMELGVVWRFKKKNGLDYSEDFRLYEQKLANLTSRVGGKKVLSMNGVGDRSGIYIPEGSWS